MSDRRVRFRTTPGQRAVLVAAILLSGCGGCREKVTGRMGALGYWHLERARTTFVWRTLNRIGFLRARLKDSGYKGERWWYVSPDGKRVFMRFVNLAAPDSRDADPGAFMPRAVQWAQDWGFTGIGYGADPAGWLPSADKLPAVANCALDKWGAGLAQGVFDGSVAQVASASQALATALKDSKQVAGVLWEAQPVTSGRSLLLAYSAMKAESFSKRRLVDFIKEQCRNDIGLLRIRFPWARRFEDLLARGPWDEYEQIDADGDAFAARLMDEYGKRVQAEIRNRFPNYLSLGPLLSSGVSPVVAEAIAPHVDVLTFSVWSADGRLPRQYLEQLNAKTGKPLLVLEYGEKLVAGSGPAIVQSVEGMAESARRGILGTASLPFAVGFGWTGYRDAPGEAWGLLDGSSAPREPVVRAAREANSVAQAHHRDLASIDEAPFFYDADRFAKGAPSLGIGRLPLTVSIDGDLRDWPQAGFQLKGLTGARDLDPKVPAAIRIGWNDRGLLLGITSPEADTVDLISPVIFWKDADYVDICVDGSGARGAAFTSASLHVVLLPRGAGKDGRAATAVGIHHEGDGLKETMLNLPGVEVASSIAANIEPRSRGSVLKLARPGWTIEALIPWSAVAVQPRTEVRVGFNAAFHFQRGAIEETGFWARPRGEDGLDHPTNWGTLVLKEQGE